MPEAIYFAACDFHNACYFRPHSNVDCFDVSEIFYLSLTEDEYTVWKVLNN
jgi:hypothetical protein